MLKNISIDKASFFHINQNRKKYVKLMLEIETEILCIELPPSAYSLKSHVKNEHMVLRCREEGCSFATKSALLIDNHMVDTHQKAVKVYHILVHHFYWEKKSTNHRTTTSIVNLCNFKIIEGIPVIPFIISYRLR